MAKKRGRPPVDPDKAKVGYLDIRLEVAEKQAFKDAAELAGLPLSAWVRERLRQAARQELEGSGRPVAFLPRPGRKGASPARSVEGDA